MNHTALETRVSHLKIAPENHTPPVGVCPDMFCARSIMRSCTRCTLLLPWRGYHPCSALGSKAEPRHVSRGREIIRGVDVHTSDSYGYSCIECAVYIVHVHKTSIQYPSGGDARLICTTKRGG